MRYTAIDIEATGLNPQTERIIEIAAITREDGKEIGRFSTLVRPVFTGIAGMAELSERIVELTGITAAMLADAPDEKTALTAFLDFMKDETVILGHNVNCDYAYLKWAAARNGLELSYTGIDTLRLSRMLRPDLEKKTLSAMKEAYGICTECEHRAAEDAVASAMLYEKLKEEFGADHPEAFLPVPFSYKVKKQTPASKRQLENLQKRLAECMPEVHPDLTGMTKSEASRLTDYLILHFKRPEA